MMLEQWGVYDYSLIVGVGDPSENAEGRQCFVDVDSSEVYFMGIIDYLGEYNTLRVMENALKTTFSDRTPSCVPPKQYRERLMRFLRSKVFDGADLEGCVMC